MKSLKINIKTINTALLFLFVAIFISCGVKKVHFEIPVDTKTKTINKQVKKVYLLNDIGVFASNKFDASRLNGFEKVNDSTVKVII